MNKLPTLLIIGAQKSGTTSLYQYTKQHPQVFMSPAKEPPLFTYEGQAPPNPSIITTFEDYAALFTEAKDEIARGEASPYWKDLYKPKLSEGIKGTLIEYYRDDVLSLEELLQRDISLWLQ